MKIAMIIAFQDFRDEEYFIPKGIFISKGFLVETFSSKKGDALGSYGGVVKVEKTIEELNVNDFDIIIFVGGNGAVSYSENKIAHKIAKGAKTLGAICIAPIILAKAGVLKGKKATVFSSEMDKSAIKILEKEGAEYEPKEVVVDGNIITANGSKAARNFAEAVVFSLKD